MLFAGFFALSLDHSVVKLCIVVTTISRTVTHSQSEASVLTMTLLSSTHSLFLSLLKIEIVKSSNSKQKTTNYFRADKKNVGQIDIFAFLSFS